MTDLAGEDKARRSRVYKQFLGATLPEDLHDSEDHLLIRVDLESKRIVEGPLINARLYSNWEVAQKIESGLSNEDDKRRRYCLELLPGHIM